jgi:hypothetical protein
MLLGQRLEWQAVDELGNFRTGDVLNRLVAVVAGKPGQRAQRVRRPSR